MIGVTMRLWTDERPKSSAGTSNAAPSRISTTPAVSPDNSASAHYVMNFEEEFKEHVVDRFVAEYAAGRTPNPCVRCNEHIKYRALLDRLPALDAGFVATGHYARVERGVRRASRLIARPMQQGPVVRALHAQQDAARDVVAGRRLTKAEVRATRGDSGSMSPKSRTAWRSASCPGTTTVLRRGARTDATRRDARRERRGGRRPSRRCGVHGRPAQGTGDRAG